MVLLSVIIYLLIMILFGDFDFDLLEEMIEFTPFHVFLMLLTFSLKKLT